jgi:hypothetical protein
MQFKCFIYCCSLSSGWTQPSNWIGYSTWTSDRTPHVHILAASNFGDFIGFTTGTYPTPTLRTTDYSVLSNKTPIGFYVNFIIIHSSLVNNPVVSPGDVIDAFQIVDTMYVSNINYQPSVEKFVKLTKGTYNSMIIYLTDNNNNSLTLLDCNLLITLLLKKKYHYIDRICTFVPSFIRLPTSHRGRGMTCGSGIDDYLLSLVKEINLNSKKKEE